MFSRTDDAGAVAPNTVRRSEPRSPAGMCRQARGTAASAGRAAKISAPRFFLLPRKTLRERTADAGRNDDAMRLGPARASKERFSRPERRILHGGRPYMAWNGHGVQPASSVLTFTAGVHACYQFIRFTHLKFSKPMAVLCIDEKVWQAFVGRLETLAERARLLEHRYEPRTDSS